MIGLVGHGLDRLLARLEPLLGERSTWPGREALLAALNGVLGDYLAASNNRWRSPCACAGAAVSLPNEAQGAGRGDPAAPAASWSCCCTACA